MMAAADLALILNPPPRCNREAPTDQAARMLALGEFLAAGGVVTTAYIRARFGVSRATAKRDLVKIEASLPVRVELDPFRAAPGKEKRTVTLPRR